MFDLESYLDSKRILINSHLDKILQNPSNSSRLMKAIHYSLMANGKRLRPVLCIAAAEVVGGQTKDVLKVACALEMIHTYSLIHDDLPAMDDDDVRRGKPTCHIAFDEASAILAGDALLTMAFQLLSAVEISNGSQALTWLRVIHRIADAAGYRGMIAGQMKDIASENNLLTLEELEELHALKTGALIEASVYSGATIGGGHEEQIDQLREAVCELNPDVEICGKKGIFGKLKDLFLITAYTPDDERKNLLRDFISSIDKKLFDIMVVSHSSIPEDTAMLRCCYDPDPESCRPEPLFQTSGPGTRIRP